MTDDVSNKRVSGYEGFDYPTLVVPTVDSSVKGISFHLGDLNITSEMSKVPDFYAAALDRLATADGIIELVWRLSDFTTLSDSADTSMKTFSGNVGQATAFNDGNGSQGVGGWASLFQFSVKDISLGTISGNSSRTVDTIANQAHSIKGICVQGKNSNATPDGESESDEGYWPVKLNVMRGIVTSQEGSVFDNMPSLPSSAENGTQYSAAEHYLNYVGKELTGARTGAQLFENTKDILNHLVGESGAAGSDVSGVQRKIWEAINAKLTNADNSDPSSNNIATKLVRHMLDPVIVDTSTNVTLMRNRFFGGNPDPSGDSTTFKRFGPSGGDCSGVMVGVDFTEGDVDFSHYVDVPLAHGDVLEFNLTLTGATNSGGDRGQGGSGTLSKPAVGSTADPSGTIASSGTSEETQPGHDATFSSTGVSGTGTDRFGGFLPGNNAIRDVVYRVRVHLEGVDQRPLT